jgi:hypothetical protein
MAVASHRFFPLQIKDAIKQVKRDADVHNYTCCQHFSMSAQITLYEALD